MKSFIFRGLYDMTNMYKYELITKSFDLETFDYIDEHYKLFKAKITDVCKFLVNNGRDPNEWDIDYILEDTKLLKRHIKEKYVYTHELDWRIYLDNKILQLLEKYCRAFKFIDEMNKDDSEKYEQYFDLLCNMFGNIEEYIEIEYTLFRKNNKNIINKNLNFEKIIKNNNIIVKYTKNSIVEEEDITVAA